MQMHCRLPHTSTLPDLKVGNNRQSPRFLNGLQGRNRAKHPTCTHTLHPSANSTGTATETEEVLNRARLGAGLSQPGPHSSGSPQAVALSPTHNTTVIPLPALCPPSHLPNTHLKAVTADSVW